MNRKGDSRKNDFNHVDVWLARLYHLLRTAEEWRQHMILEQFEPKELPPYATNYPDFQRARFIALDSALLKYREFVELVIKRYVHGILSPNRQFESGKSAEVHLLRTVINHLTADLDLIKTAIDQRVIGLSDRSRSAITLFFADILAQKSLAPALKTIKRAVKPEFLFGSGLDTTIETVAYFSHNTKVRSLPYDPSILLVGLPSTTGNLLALVVELDDIDRELQKRLFDGRDLSKADEILPFSALVPWDALMLPHEVGHYIYWNGRMPTPDQKNGVNNQSDGDGYDGPSLKVVIQQDLSELDLAEKRQGLPNADWRTYWLEELFCDVYCCLILGPIAVLGLHAVLSDSPRDGLFINSGAHPISGLRPFIACRILELAYPNRFPHAIIKLKAEWEASLAELGLADKLNQPITIHTAGMDTSGWLNHSFGNHQAASTTSLDHLQLTAETISQRLDPLLEILVNRLQPLLESTPQNSLPWSSELPLGQELTYYEQLLIRLTQWPEDEINMPSVDKSAIQSFAVSQLYSEINELEGDELVQHLIDTFLTNWGDKGNKKDSGL